MQHVMVGTAVGVLVLLLVVLLWRRRSSGRSTSKAAHDAATAREPPVDIGDVRTLGVTEFTDHHTGARVAVGKVEGFVVFTEDVPADVDVGDVIRAKITSFNRGHTSADARFVETM